MKVQMKQAPVPVLELMVPVLEESLAQEAREVWAGQASEMRW